MMRSAGVLLHVTSLPGPGPIGNMGPAARQFLDFLAEAGQKLWQVLPLTPPASGNSPYSAYSVFAGNPLLISPEDLEEEELLPPGSCAALYANGPFPEQEVDFERAENLLLPLLWESFAFSREKLKEEFATFRREQSFWLEDYALFMALRQEQGGCGFRNWPRPLLFREKQAMEKAAHRLAEEVDFYIFVQYLFFRQWTALRHYANQRGIRIFGDVPIYVDGESADVWANPWVFQLDEDLQPVEVAGVPPDAFSEDGQLWGNPIYRWDALQADGYSWWIRRLTIASQLYDWVRIDHFRGLESYWAIPRGAPTARIGSWKKGPAMDFLHEVKKALPHCHFVAEDLGFIGDEVRALLAECGFPGLAVLQFAFEPWNNSPYLPHNMHRNLVAYIGTHDNDTALGWLTSAPPEQVNYAREYMNLSQQEGEVWAMLRTLYASVADTVVAMAQDLLELGSQARMNIPARAEGNWKWRVASGAFIQDLAQRLLKLTKLYGR